MRKIHLVLASLMLVGRVGGLSLHLEPETLHIEPGQDALFLCFYPQETHSWNWTINGIAASTQNAVAMFGNGFGTLTLMDTPATYNLSIIQCSAMSTGRTILSNNAMLVLIEDLPSVNYLDATLVTGSRVCVNWTSINFTDTYCVKVENTTSFVLQMKCGLNTTMYKFALPYESWCHRYFFTVSLDYGVERTTSYVQNISLPMVTDEIIEIGPLNYKVVMSDPVCGAEVEIIDPSIETKINVTNITYAGRNVMFSAQEQLKFDYQYNITVNASNIHGSASSRATVYLTPKPMQPTETMDPSELTSEPTNPPHNIGILLVSILVPVAAVIITIIVLIAIITCVCLKRRGDSTIEASGEGPHNYNESEL